VHEATTTTTRIGKARFTSALRDHSTPKRGDAAILFLDFTAVNDLARMPSQVGLVPLARDPYTPALAHLGNLSAFRSARRLTDVRRVESRAGWDRFL
jgi:hypothetical protein